jgi:pilus assembly protein CpaE
MADDLNELLKRARKAYKSGERGKAAYYIDRILKQDLMHRGAWKLLYREYGSGLTLEEFQIEFIEHYYPERVDAHLGGAPKGWKGSQDEAGAAKQSQPASIPSPAPPVIPVDQPPAQAANSAPSEPALRPAQKTSSTTKTGPLVKPAPAGMEEANPPAPPAPKPPQAAQPQPVEKRPTPDLKPAQAKTEIQAKAGPTPAPASPMISHIDRNPKIRVLVADDTAQTRETIIRSLSFEREIEVVASAENGIQAVELARQTRPDVVLMDVNMPDMDGINATVAILERVPFTQVVILTVQNDPDYMRRAMMAGARDFLAKPPALEDLLNTVLQAGKIAHQEIRKASQIKTGGLGKLSALSAHGKLIAVYSPKGGVGCSTIVANLGVALHNEETNVLLVDGNLQFGDIAELFNVRSAQSILNLATSAYDLDVDIVEEALAKHESGVKILTPTGPAQAEMVSSDSLIEILNYLRERYPYVLVNTSSQLTDATIAALETCNLIILLVTQEISSITKVRRFLDTLSLLKIDRNRILLVLNQFDRHAEITPDMISKSLKVEIAKVIPKDERVTIPSINRGVPFMLKQEIKNRQIVRSTLDLAELVRRKLLELAAAAESEEKQAT